MMVLSRAEKSHPRLFKNSEDKRKYYKAIINKKGAWLRTREKSSVGVPRSHHRMPPGPKTSHATCQMSIAKSLRPPRSRHLLNILVLLRCRSPQEASLTGPNNFSPLPIGLGKGVGQPVGVFTFIRPSPSISEISVHCMFITYNSPLIFTYLNVNVGQKQGITYNVVFARGSYHFENFLNGF